MKVSFKYLRPLNIHNFVNELHHLAVWGRSCLTLCIAQTKFWNKDIEIDPNLCLYSNAAAAAAESLQSCPTLWDPIDGSPPGSPVPRILQARTLKWVAISFSNAWKWKVKSESEVAQSCPTLCNPMDYSPSGSSVHGILQARVLEWGAIAFSEWDTR